MQGHAKRNRLPIPCRSALMRLARQGIELVRAFVQELAGGKAIPFFAAIHDKPGTKDEANPHVHLVIRDRDPATGKGRVIGMSEKGSTERAREIWEQVCNEALRDAHHSARVDRRSLIDQGITNRKSPGHEGPQPRQIEAKGRPSDKLERIRIARKAPPKLHSALGRATQRERGVRGYRAAQTRSEALTRAADKAVRHMRHEAERIWRDQKDKTAATRSLRTRINGILGTRIFPESVTQHMKDISTIVFRRQPKQPMPLRDTATPAGSQQMVQPCQPKRRSKFGPSV